MTPQTVVVVGESLAGMTAARELRALGYPGRLLVVGEEVHGAYNRPPLSKLVLVDASSDDSVSIPGDDLDVDFVRGCAVGLDPAAHRVYMADGNSLSYDALVIATGAAARRLASADQRGELVLRTLDDAQRLRDRMDVARSAIVVGGGFLGMEVVSACVRRGLAVTVVDVDPPLRRLLGSYLSDLASARARAKGVSVLRSSVALSGDPVTGVTLAAGEELVADIVVTCAGEVPNTSWLQGSGLEIGPGVIVDTAGRTNYANVYAAGDVACVKSYDRLVRRPFWANAVAQGRMVAHSILASGQDRAHFDNYFWTEILGLPVKVVGELPVSGEPEIVEGSPATGALLRWPRPDGCTVVAWGLKRPLPRLRAMAAGAASPAPPSS